MAVHGTENYVYYTDKVLGAGSTGTVYFGRHKRKGDACAIKLFSSSTGSRAKVQVRENELEFMRRLQHKNIVTFLAIETDSKTEEVALVMELCSEGSLQKRLSEPEFLHGLGEEEYVIFLIQFAAGLSYLRLHGVTHRDIKPGNILCNKQEDGSIVYKITDFGSSRELLGEDKSKALYGTEEYLHPAVYRCIFIEKTRYGDEFESSAERWSIGVTMYQVATGRLPFQVQGGRGNRETMYHIISTKASGVISAVQKESSSEIEERTSLPDTCTFSSGFKDFLVPIIAGLLENNFQRQMTFESFFPRCEELESLIVIYVFCVVTCVYLHVYLRPSDTYSNFQLAVEKIKGFHVTEQCFYLEKKLLVEVVTPDSTIQLYPRTTLDNPILLVLSGVHLRDAAEPDFLLPNPPNTPADKNLIADATWSRDVCAYFLRLQSVVIYFSRIQQNTSRCKIRLVATLASKLKGFESTRVELESNFRIVKFNVYVLCNIMTNRFREIKQLISDRYGIDKSQKDLRSDRKELEEVSGMETDWDAVNLDVSAKLIEMEERHKLIDRLLQKYDRMNLTAEQMVASGCEEYRCETRVNFNIKLAKTTYDQFSRDRKRQLTYNEDQIHKYERIKLEQKITAVRSILFKHCLPHSVKMNQDCRQWLRETFNSRWTEINKLEEEIRKFKAALSDVTLFLHESYKISEEKLQRITNRLFPEHLKSSGYHTQSGSIGSGFIGDVPVDSNISAKTLKNQMQLINQCYEDNNQTISRTVQPEVRSNEELMNRFVAFVYDWRCTTLTSRWS